MKVFDKIDELQLLNVTVDRCFVITLFNDLIHFFGVLFEAFFQIFDGIVNQLLSSSLH